jgi:hypothetical protein
MMAVMSQSVIHNRLLFHAIITINLKSCNGLQILRKMLKQKSNCFYSAFSAFVASNGKSPSGVLAVPFILLPSMVALMGIA